MDLAFAALIADSASQSFAEPEPLGLKSAKRDSISSIREQQEGLSLAKPGKSSLPEFLDYVFWKAMSVVSKKYRLFRQFSQEVRNKKHMPRAC